MDSLQKDSINISDPKTVKVYKKPITKKILGSFSNNPKTASDIAKTISFPKEKIYYHIKNLVNLKLLLISSTDVIKGIEQKKYLPTAKKFQIIKPKENEINGEKNNLSNNYPIKNDPIISEKIISGKKTKRENFERRRKKDRRIINRRYLTNQRKTNNSFKGEDKRENQDRRLQKEQRVKANRRKINERRFTTSTEINHQQIKKTSTKGTSKTYKNLFLGLNGVKSAMTFVHTGKNVTFLYCKLKSNGFQIEHVNNYELPIKIKNDSINTLTELILNVSNQFISKKQKKKIYLAVHSDEYQYEMTYVLSKGKNNKLFKKNLKHILKNNYGIHENSTLVDFERNYDQNNRATVCYSKNRPKVEKDYQSLKNHGLQPRYNTSIPQILNNIYKYYNLDKNTEFSLLIYIDRFKTHCVFIKINQIIESTEINKGLNYFVDPLKEISIIKKESESWESNAMHFLSFYGLEEIKTDKKIQDGFPLNKAHSIVSHLAKSFIDELKESIYNFENNIVNEGYTGKVIEKVFISGVGSHIKNFEKKLSNGLGISVQNLKKYNTAFIAGENDSESFLGNFKNHNLFKKKNNTENQLEIVKTKIKDHEKAIESAKSPESAKYRLTRLEIEKNSKIKSLDQANKKLIIAAKEFKGIKDSYIESQGEMKSDLESISAKLDENGQVLLDKYKDYEILGKKISELEYESDHAKEKKNKREISQERKYNSSLKNAARSRNKLIDDKETFDSQIDNYETDIIKLEESIKTIDFQLGLGKDEVSVFEYLKDAIQTTANAFKRSFLKHLKSLDNLKEEDLNELQRSGYLLTQNTSRIDEINESFNSIVSEASNNTIDKIVDGKNGVEIRKKLLNILSLVLEAPENLIRFKNLTSSAIKINQSQNDLFSKKKELNNKKRLSKSEIKDNKKNLILLKKEISLNEEDLSKKLANRDEKINILNYVRTMIEMIQDLNHHDILIKELLPQRKKVKEDIKNIKKRLSRLNTMIESCEKNYDKLGIEQHDLKIEFDREQNFLFDQAGRYSEDEIKIKKDIDRLVEDEKSLENNYSNALSYINQLEKQCVSKKFELEKLDEEKIPLVKAFEEKKTALIINGEKEKKDIDEEKSRKISEAQKTKSITINNFFKKEKKELEKKLAKAKRLLTKSEKEKIIADKYRIRENNKLSELKKKKNPQINTLKKKVREWEKDLSRGRRIQDRLDILESKKIEWDELLQNEKDNKETKLDSLNKSINRKNSDSYKLFLKDGLRRFHNDGETDDLVKSMANDSINLDQEEIEQVEQSFNRFLAQYESFITRYKKNHRDILKKLKPFGGRRKIIVGKIQNTKKKIYNIEAMIKKSIDETNQRNEVFINKEKEFQIIKEETKDQIVNINEQIEKIPYKKTNAIDDIDKNLRESLDQFSEKKSIIDNKVARKIQLLNTSFSKEELILIVNEAEKKMMFYISEIEKTNGQINSFISGRNKISKQKSILELNLSKILKKHEKNQKTLLDKKNQFDERSIVIKEKMDSNRSELSIIEEQLLTVDKQKDELYSRLLEVEKDYDKSNKVVADLKAKISVPGKKSTKKRISRKEQKETLVQMEKDTVIDIDRSEALIKELNIVLDTMNSDRTGIESSINLLEHDLEYFNTDLSRIDTLIKNNKEHLDKIASDHRNALNCISNIKELYPPCKIMLNERITNLYTIIELKQKDRNDLELRFDEIQEKLKSKRVEAAIVDQKLSKINDGMKKALEKSFYEQDDSGQEWKWEIPDPQLNSYAELAKMKTDYKELFNSILDIEKEISRLKNQESSINNVISENEKISHKKIKKMEERCTRLELLIAKERNEILGIEQEVKQLSSLAFNYGDRIEILDQELKDYREKQTEYEVTLQELNRSVKSIKETSYSISKGQRLKKGNTIEIDFMANLGLLMDPHTSLNILPDKHKKEFQYFRPNQILQNAVLGLIMVFSLGAYNQRSKITDLEKHLPAKYSELKLLDIRKEMKQVVINENMVAGTYSKLVKEDQRVSKDMVSVLKYLSQNIPKNFHVTNLTLEKDESKINPNSVRSESSELIIVIDGFFKNNLDKSLRHIDKIKQKFIESKKFKNIYVSSGKKTKNKGTAFTLNVIR